MASYEQKNSHNKTGLTVLIKQRHCESRLWRDEAISQHTNICRDCPVATLLAMTDVTPA